ncbi:hypothetical protein [Streptomyces spinosisporus]|uniref:Uncharacterized protein n=1 Tax=Streptomyces spinosisporus TaxID=2927582 RepID=A0ABS9XFR9_9ACTN|nr:hypothetical protein [Streptomyces spinosisporus]MCI3240881.1 hypothetical protein [Streptomyces spinosisporus]
MSGTDFSRTGRDTRLHSVAAVWERAGFPPASALRHAEICLTLADHDDRVRLIAAMWANHGFPPADAVQRAEICLILAAPTPSALTRNRNRKKEAK